LSLLNQLILRKKAVSLTCISLFLQENNQYDPSNHLSIKRQLIMSPVIKKRIELKGGKSSLNLLKGIFREKIHNEIRNAFNLIHQSGLHKKFQNESNSLLFLERLHGLTSSHRKRILSFVFFTLKGYLSEDLNREQRQGLNVKAIENQFEPGRGLRFSKQSFGNKLQEGYETFDPLRESSSKEVIIHGLVNNTESTPRGFSTEVENSKKGFVYERNMSREDGNYETEKRRVPSSYTEERQTTKQSEIFSPKTQLFSESETPLMYRQGKQDFEPVSQILSETTRSSPRRKVQDFNRNEFYDQTLSRGQTNLAEELLNENNKRGDQNSGYEGQTVRTRTANQEPIINSQKP